jgi:hypothetical protein
MVQGGSGLSLALKAGQSLRVFGYIVGQKFQGDETVQLNILGLVDDAHASTAKLLDDPVVGNGLAEHSVNASGWVGRESIGRNWS